MTVPANSGCRATNVAVGSPATGDNGGLATVTNSGLASYPLGTNVVTWTVMDTSGNTSSCQQRVIVRDSQAPTIAWHLTNLVVAAGTNCHAFMPDVTGTNYILAVDNCSSVTVTQSVLTNAVLSLGANEVVLGAFDDAGNAAYCTNYILVVDQTPPVITCPTNMVVSADAGQCGKSNVTWEVAASDNCSVTSLVSEPPSGSTFPVGVTTVRCTAADSSGNTNGCSFTVTVVAPPVVLRGPADQTVPLGQEAAFYLSATNDCGGQLTYQWRFQGAEIPGATTNRYTLTTVRLTNTGNYDVVVTNLDAAVTSPVAVLTVVGPYLTVYPVELSQPDSGRTNFIFAFPTVTGIDYVVQYKDALADTNDWLPFVTNSGTGGLITNDFPIPADLPGRFYRILVP